PQVNEAAWSRRGEREKMEIGETRLQRQDADQQERRSIRARQAARAFGVEHGSVDDAPREIGERQTEQAARKQRCQRGAKSGPVGTQVPEQLQRLPERFPIQFYLRKFDSGLVIA